MLFTRKIGLSRTFSSLKTLDWNSGLDAITEKLFQIHTVAVPEGPRVDPRGMRVFELKKLIRGIPEFRGDLDLVKDHHPLIIEKWQQLYNNFMNGNVKLPGRDPAGPLTFHHDADKVNVRVMYDKHGRVEH